MSNEQLIANKYIIKEKKGKGYSAEVYRVEDKETKKNFACKILIKDDSYFDKEKEILELLKKNKVPNIVNLIACGTEKIDLGEGPSESKYLILEYMEKGDLCLYMNIAPLKETHAKLFFKKILKAVQYLHKNKVYHRDLKTQNILLDNEFNPKLCDFGFSTITKSGLRECLGSPEYAAPEIYKCFYDGEKVDVFALGVILFNLVTGTFGFDRALKQDIMLEGKRVKKDLLYILIAYNVYSKFWEIISSRIDKEVSKEFKDLYVKMVAEKPSKRPTIEEVLKDEWMKEINDKNDKEIEALELKIIEDFLDKEKLIKDSITNKTTIKTDNDGENIKGENRGLLPIDNKKNVFESNILPKIFKEGKYLEYYNKIKGDLVPVKFMNNLTKKLRKENDKKEREYDCKIEPSQYKLKFRATFEKIEVENDKETYESIMKELKKLKLEEGNEEEKKENQEEEEEEEEEDDDDNNVKIYKRTCSIQIELYEYKENKEKIHLLRYVRKSGELDDFYKLLKYINNCVDDIINI